MRRWHRFMGLSPRKQGLLLGALFLLGVIRLGLWLLPLPTLQRLLARLSRAATELREATAASVGRIGWAVRVASRCVPGVRCLAAALTAQVLLRRHGHPACLHIGIGHGKGGRLRAHAWVECQGQVVIGGSLEELACYLPLPIPRAKSPGTPRWLPFPRSRFCRPPNALAPLPKENRDD